MNEKVQDFRGLSALLIGYREEGPGKTQANISLLTGDPISHWVYGPGKDPAL